MGCIVRFFQGRGLSNFFSRFSFFGSRPADEAVSRVGTSTLSASRTDSGGITRHYVARQNARMSTPKRKTLILEISKRLCKDSNCYKTLSLSPTQTDASKADLSFAQFLAVQWCVLNQPSDQTLTKTQLLSTVKKNLENKRDELEEENRKLFGTCSAYRMVGLRGHIDTLIGIIEEIDAVTTQAVDQTVAATLCPSRDPVPNQGVAKHYFQKRKQLLEDVSGIVEKLIKIRASGDQGLIPEILKKQLDDLAEELRSTASQEQRIEVSIAALGYLRTVRADLIQSLHQVAKDLGELKNEKSNEELKKEKIKSLQKKRVFLQRFFPLYRDIRYS